MKHSAFMVLYTIVFGLAENIMVPRVGVVAHLRETRGFCASL